ncbi:protein kinase C delta type-like [Pelodytes ibericus]
MTTLTVMAPTSLERLVSHKVLGEGGYGQVKLACDLVSKRWFAVKGVRKSSIIVSRDVMIEKRVLEIAAGGNFCTRLYSTFQTPSHLYYVMDFLSGGCLDDYIYKNGKLPLATTTFIAAEIVCGLQYLHGKGIVHRDLKPDNILLTGEGHIKICDFGLAVSEMFGDRTAEGMAGTTGYIAPEMLNRSRYNAAIDWWALGIIIFQMSTGKLPFSNNGSTVLVSAVLNNMLTFPDCLSPDTEAQRKAFQQITIALHNAGVKFKWGFPVKLLITRNRVMTALLTPRMTDLNSSNFGTVSETSENCLPKSPPYHLQVPVNP